jgi:ubiquinone/menaquinone biosynthesis C-methylase UbiE
MILQGQHGILSQPNHDEFAREDFLASMRNFFTTELFPGNRELYRKTLLPAFVKAHGRPPASRREVKDMMEGTFYYRGVSLLGRATQELLWDTVGDSVERQIDTLMEKAKPPAAPTGSLTIDPNFKMPRYMEAVDIHVMPGNFQTELSRDDMFAGALYDRGAYVFAYGSRGTYNDGVGRSFVQMFKAKFPGFKPGRILEIGCGVGSSTVAIKQGFPDADVYAVDVAAPMLRYAHARAESLGVPIHFSQQDGASLNFPDGYFDLTLSLLVHHEMPLEFIKGTLKECYRLLPPGGVMIHEGYSRKTDPFDDFWAMWFTANINEPFSNAQYDLDFKAACEEVGFPGNEVFSGTTPATYLKGQNSVVTYRGAVKR